MADEEPEISKKAKIAYVPESEVMGDIEDVTNES